MKRKLSYLLLACVLVAAFVLGAAGAVTFAKDEPADSSNGANKDRLIGVFITTEHLNLSGVNSEPSRLYAELVDQPYTQPETGDTITEKNFAFVGIDGISFFTAQYKDDAGNECWGSDGDDGVSDIHTGYHSTDAGESIELHGTIYVSAPMGSAVFFFNPVYQTPDGAVYVTSGQGMGMSGGGSMTHGLKEEQTVTVDGENASTYTDVEVTICAMDTPTALRVLQFDGDGGVVADANYPAGALPSELDPAPNAEYIIVETYMKSANGAETVMRDLFQPEDESLFAFVCREDGICVKQYCSILWDQIFTTQ